MGGQSGAAGQLLKPTIPGMPEVSRRVLETDVPVMVKSRRLLGGATDVLSLAQGTVHWGPPPSAVAAAAAEAGAPAMSVYGADEGTPELCAALRAKLEAENHLPGYNVIVTAGANQGYSSLILTLVDAADRVVLFKPYYFNALMAIQMGGGGANVVFGPFDAATMHPDLDWLERELAGPSPPKLVSIVNPCNPTGVSLSRAELERAAELTRRAGAWLIMDNTYEHFVYGDTPHVCVSAPHIVHLFSFSKAYGMMGWRVGYIAYPDFDGRDYLGAQLVKVQDTVPICAALLSQRVALGALRLGRGWVQQQADSIRSNREVLLDALSPLGRDKIWGGDAIYMWAQLPPGCEDDEAVVHWMVASHGVAVIPGSASGCPGYIRCTFGKPAPAEYGAAAARLKRALQQLVDEGFAAVQRSRNADK